MKEKSNHQWINKNVEEILIALGYDINKDISKQFEEKHGDKLKGLPVPPIKKRPRKSLPTRYS